MAEGDGSMHTNSSGDRMARAVENCMEYEEQIKPLIASNVAEMQRIEQAVDALDDPLEREVIRLRYMDSSNCRQNLWHDVAVQLYGDDDAKYLHAVMRLHGLAIQHLAS